MLVLGPIIGHLWLWPIYNTKNQASSPFLVLVFSDGPERKPKKKASELTQSFFLMKKKKVSFFFFFLGEMNHTCTKWRGNGVLIQIYTTNIYSKAIVIKS